MEDDEARVEDEAKAARAEERRGAMVGVGRQERRGGGREAELAFPTSSPTPLASSVDGEKQEMGHDFPAKPIFLFLDGDR